MVGLRGPGKQAGGLFSPSNGPAGPGSPSMSNPQQRHARCEENFCGAELAPRSKNSYLAPLPPGSPEGTRGKGEGVPEMGF